MIGVIRRLHKLALLFRPFDRTFRGHIKPKEIAATVMAVGLKTATLRLKHDDCTTYRCI